MKILPILLLLLSAAAMASGQAQKPTIPITQITIQRNPGLTSAEKPLAFYTMTLRNNGQATLVRVWKPKGLFQTTVPASRFISLANRISHSGFFHYSPCYGPGMLDTPTVAVSAVRQGKRKVVLDQGQTSQPKYETNTPQPLKQIEREMDAIAMSARWVKTSNSAVQPNYQSDLSEELRAQINLLRQTKSDSASK